jgi:hypothetical protein
MPDRFEPIIEHLQEVAPPESAQVLEEQLISLTGLFEKVASVVGRVAERLGQEYPVHPSVPERLKEVARKTAGAATLADEAVQAFRKTDADDPKVQRPENVQGAHAGSDGIRPYDVPRTTGTPPDTEAESLPETAAAGGFSGSDSGGVNGTPPADESPEGDGGRRIRQPKGAYPELKSGNAVRAEEQLSVQNIARAYSHWILTSEGTPPTTAQANQFWASIDMSLSESSGTVDERLAWLREAEQGMQQFLNEEPELNERGQLKLAVHEPYRFIRQAHAFMPLMRARIEDRALTDEDKRNMFLGNAAVVGELVNAYDTAPSPGDFTYQYWASLAESVGLTLPHFPSGEPVPTLVPTPERIRALGGADAQVLLTNQQTGKENLLFDFKLWARSRAPRGSLRVGHIINQAVQGRAVSVSEEKSEDIRKLTINAARQIVRHSMGATIAPRDLEILAGTQRGFADRIMHGVHRLKDRDGTRRGFRY